MWKERVGAIMKQNIEGPSANLRLAPLCLYRRCYDQTHNRTGNFIVLAGCVPPGTGHSPCQLRDCVWLVSATCV